MNIFRHLGASSVKEKFSFEIESIKLPIMRNVNPGDSLRVTIERGSKIKLSGPHVVGDAEGPVGDTIVAFGETLTMSVTLYRSGSGFMEKNATLNVKLIKGRSKKETVLGSVLLELHELSKSDGGQFNLPLSHCSTDGASVKLYITKGKLSDEDDNASVRSNTPPKSSLNGKSTAGSVQPIGGKSTAGNNAAMAAKKEEMAAKLEKLQRAETSQSNSPADPATGRTMEQPNKSDSSPAATSNWDGFADFDNWSSTPSGGNAFDAFPSNGSGAAAETVNDSFSAGSPVKVGNPWTSTFDDASWGNQGTSNVFAGSWGTSDEKAWPVSNSDALFSSDQPPSTGSTESPELSAEEKRRRQREAAQSGITGLAANKELKAKLAMRIAASGAPAAAAHIKTTDDQEVIATKAEYFEREAARLNQELLKVCEDRNIAYVQNHDLSEKLTFTSAEASKLALALSDARMELARLTIEVSQSRRELKELRTKNLSLAQDIGSLEVVIAEHRIENRNRSVSLLSPQNRTNNASSGAQAKGFQRTNSMSPKRR